MANEIKVPKAPYIFQSGKHVGDAVENFIFRNSNYLFHVRNRKHREKDALDQHLDFIFDAGSKLQTKVTCPFCQKKMVKYFLFDSLFFLPGLTCCENNLCKESLKALHPGINLVPFQVSTLGNFKKVGEQKKAETFFRKIYGMPRRITPQIVLTILRTAIGDPEPLQPQPLRLRRKNKKIDAVQTKLLI